MDNAIKAQFILAGVITVGFLVVTAFYFFGPTEISGGLKEPMLLVTGAWITNLTTVVQYFFGSSKGSADKNELIKR